MRKAARDFCPEEWERREEERQSGGKTVNGWRAKPAAVEGLPDGTVPLLQKA